MLSLQTSMQHIKTFMFLEIGKSFNINTYLHISYRLFSMKTLTYPFLFSLTLALGNSNEIDVFEKHFDNHQINTIGKLPNTNQTFFFSKLPQGDGVIFGLILSYLDPTDKNTMQLQRVCKFFYEQFLNIPHLIPYTSFNDFQNKPINRYMNLIEIAAFRGDEQIGNILYKLHYEGINCHRADNNQFIRLANNGIKSAEILVSEGYAKGWHGFEKNKDELLKLSNKGIKAALDFVLNDYTTGVHGIAKNRTELLKLANLGIASAQEYISYGYANGRYGFTQNLGEVQKLAELGWNSAQNVIATYHAYASDKSSQAKQMLLNLSDRGWIGAQNLVADGYANQWYGFKENPEGLINLAKRGCKTAREHVARGYAVGAYGIYENNLELLKLAKLGWSEAQEFVTYGYENGIYGFKKDHDELLYLAKRGWKRTKFIITKFYTEGSYEFKQNYIQALLFGYKPSICELKKMKHLFQTPQFANFILYKLTMEKALQINSNTNINQEL